MTDTEQQWAQLSEEERYYLKKYPVKCVVCNRTDHDTHRNLEMKRWGLHPKELCPACEVAQLNREADIQLGRCQMLCDVMDRESPVKYRSEPLFEPDCPF